MIKHKKPILILFQKSAEQTNSSISTSDNPLSLTFPRDYKGRKVTLLLIRAGTDDLHDALRLVLTDIANDNEYEINKSGGVEFNILQCEYNLNFIGIQFLSDECSFSDDQRAYHINTARLLMRIETVDKCNELCYKSDLIRNNCGLSGDISIHSIGVVLDSTNKYIIYFARPVPFFTKELKVLVPKFDQKLIPNKAANFPIRELTFTTSKEIRNTDDLKDVSVTSRAFPSRTVQSSIESRKTKSEDNFNIPINVKTPECETNSIKKGVCIVISNVEFKDPKIENRYIGSLEDVENIKKGYENDYQIKLLENKTTADLKNDIIDILEDDVKENHKEIIIFVLSHGFNGGFCTVDGKMTVDELLTMFSQKEMPLLREIKKKFIFSCCQGTQSSDKYLDFYIAYSTLPGCKSHRNLSGSFFVQVFMEIKIDNPSWEIEQIFESTQRKLIGKRQIAYCQNGLFENSGGNARQIEGFSRQLSETLAHE